jgi:hypothetical protein
MAGATSASANGTPDSISLYFSAPFVTGSHVTNGAITETFNSYTTDGPCPTTITGFATVAYSLNGCAIDALAGTSTGSSEPVIFRDGVDTLSTYVWDSTGGSPNTTYTFLNPVKYVGFWWWSGSAGNTVEFLRADNTTIATLNTNDLVDAALFGPSSSVTNADSRTFTRVDGGTHLRKHYFDYPYGYSGTPSSPTFNYDARTNEQPWVYLNLFVSGSVEVKKMKLSGEGFEYDNLTISTQESGPTGSMVLAKNILGTTLPSPQIVAWSPTNTSDSSANTDHTPDQAATVTTPGSGGGAISYSVVNAGSSGCTVNSSTGVITRTAIGDCRVRATAAATANYYSAYKETTFSFSTAVAPVVTPSSSPSPSPSLSNSPSSSPSNSPSVAVALADTGTSNPYLPFFLAALLLPLGVSLLMFAETKSRRKRFLRN